MKTTIRVGQGPFRIMHAHVEFVFDSTLISLLTANLRPRPFESKLKTVRKKVDLFELS